MPHEFLREITGEGDQEAMLVLAERFRQAHDACREGPLAARLAFQSLMAHAQLLATTRFTRLAALVELWDCLRGEDGEAAEEVRVFLQDALSQFAAIDPPQWDEAARLIEVDSSARWGDYLNLIDPTEDTSSPPEVDPAEGRHDPEATSKVDAATLFALLTGQPECPVNVTPGPVARPSVSSSEPTTGTHRPQVVNQAPAAMSAGIEPLFREVFLEEAAELFDRMQTLVLELGRGDDRERVQDLKRCLHTLKGASLSVGLKDLGTTAHQAEDRINEAGSQIDLAVIGYLESVLSEIETQLTALRQGGAAPPASTSAPITFMSAPASPGDSPGEGPERPESGPTINPTRSDSETADTPIPSEVDCTLRVPAARVDEMMDLVSEMLVRRRSWQEHVGLMARWATGARSASNRLRGTIDALAVVGGRGQGFGDLLRSLTEQAEDLGVLAESARASLIPTNDEAEALGRVGLKLWDALQSVRIVPVKGLLQRLVRVAREAARLEGKTIDVRTSGEETGLDRASQDRAFEPLLHLVRNAVGHGIETVEERVALGKPPAGLIQLEARREGNAVVLGVEDDGRGLDHAKIEAKARRLGLISPEERPDLERLNRMIFQAGFSTRDEANEVAGRGVGMDVVAREVNRLHGSIELRTRPGQGTAFTVRLPARLALEQAVVVRLDGQQFGLPIDAIETTRERATAVAASLTSPPIEARSLLGFPTTSSAACPTLLIVRAGGRTAALKVDGIDGPRELIVRPLGPMLAGHPALDGVSFTTSGDVVLMLSPVGLLRLAEAPRVERIPGPASGRGRETALVVDDSISVRHGTSRHLRALGFVVDEAADGEQALRLLRERPYRLVLTDLEMPRMDGFELMIALRETGLGAGLTLLVASTCDTADVRRRVHDLGASAFLVKPVDSTALARALGLSSPVSIGVGAEGGVALCSLTR